MDQKTCEEKAEISESSTWKNAIIDIKQYMSLSNSIEGVLMDSIYSIYVLIFNLNVIQI